MEDLQLGLKGNGASGLVGQVIFKGRAQFQARAFRLKHSLIPALQYTAKFKKKLKANMSLRQNNKTGAEIWLVEKVKHVKQF